MAAGAARRRAAGVSAGRAERGRGWFNSCRRFRRRSSRRSWTTRATIRALSAAAVARRASRWICSSISTAACTGPAIAPGPARGRTLPAAVGAAGSACRGPARVRRTHARHGSGRAHGSLRRRLRAVETMRQELVGRLAGADGRRRRHADVSPSRASARTSSAAPARRCSGIWATARSFPIWISFPAVAAAHARGQQAGEEPPVPGPRAQGGRVRGPASARGAAGPARTRGGRPQRGAPGPRDRSRGGVPGRHGFYGVPWHVCPTVALHNEAVVVRNGRADERWQVVARARSLTI